MLQNIKQFYGIKLAASDGPIGHVKDFYFDDKTWSVRYLVVDTGTWLSDGQVLLTPHPFGAHAFGRFDSDINSLRVDLTKKQIEESPSIETHRPVSRQYEEEYYKYYGWQGYWQGGGMWNGVQFPEVSPYLPAENLPHQGRSQRDDRHLRSTKEIIGYHIEATDGQIGAVDSFMLDGSTWAIRELVIETGHWYAGKTILLLPENIKRIDYERSCIFVDLTKKNLEQTTRNDVAQAAATSH
jgi:hypothetical protein